MALDLPHICKAGNLDWPLDWTYHTVAALLENMAPLSHTEKAALADLVASYARDVARVDGREAPASIPAALDALAEYARDHAQGYAQTLAG